MSDTTRRWLPAGLLTALLIAAVLLLASRFKVTTSLAELMPTSEDRTLAELSAALARAPLTRSMVLTLAGPSPEVARAGAGLLAKHLHNDAGMEWVLAGPDEELEQALWQVYAPRRFLLASATPNSSLPARLDEAGLREAARELKRQLALPTSTWVDRLAPSDPLGFFRARLARLQDAASRHVRVEQGQFMTADGERAVVFLATRADAWDTTAQSRLLERLEHTFADIDRGMGGGLELAMSGLNRFFVAGEEAGRADATRVSLVSLIGVALLLLGLFRSLRVLLLALLPVAVGLLLATATCLALFGRLHAVALGFGGALIGVALDYPVHFLNHHVLAAGERTPADTMRRVRSGLALGAGTTMAGLLGLGWTSFPALREVAVFAGVGVLGALAAVFAYLPVLVPQRSSVPALLQRAASAVTRGLEALRTRRRLAIALPAVALVLTLVGLPFISWNDDIRSLTVVDQALQAEDDAVRASVHSPEPGRFVIAAGADDEAALRVNDQVARRLERAVADGTLRDFRSAHAWLWSAELQRANREALLADRSLPERLEAVFQQEGFRPGAFQQPFAQALAADVEPLTWESLRYTRLSHVVAPFRVETDSGVAWLTFLEGVADADALERQLEGLEGAHYIDQRALMSEAYGRFRTSSLELVLLGLLVVISVIALRYRRWRPTLGAIVPPLLAGGLALAVLTLAGVVLNLLHVVALLIVLCMGVDYTVFLFEAERFEEGVEATALSVVIACASTVLSFGALGLSAQPALRALGWTIGVGVLAAALLAPIAVLLARRVKGVTS